MLLHLCLHKAWVILRLDLLWPIATFCALCVGNTSEPCKMAEPFKMPFLEQTCLRSGYHVLDGCALAPPGKYKSLICINSDAGRCRHYYGHLLYMLVAEKDDPSQKSSAIRARRKRDTRRSTGKITFDEVILQFFLYMAYSKYVVR